MTEKALFAARKRYEELAAQGLKLDLTRGKPSSEQLDLSMPMLHLLNESNYKDEKGFDARNYGVLEGVPDARRLMGALIGVSAESVLMPSNSSLNIMYDTIARLMLTKAPGATKAWYEVSNRKFLCPVPGYDRHFAITEGFGFELIPIRMNADGPDMDQVRSLVASDPAIKGMWTVPMYSNPGGNTYSEEICRELASMPTAAEDFRIMWDMAYCVHHLYPGNEDHLPNMMKLCEEAGNPDRVLIFASTSKVTFAGSGIACIAGSEANLKWFKKHQTLQMVCPDKITQLQHVRFFKDLDAVKAHMVKHAEILRPKFELLLSALDDALADLPEVSYSRPKGGYFICLNLPQGTATKLVKLADEAGIKVSPAGCTHPYGKDPEDAILRLAPSFPNEATLVKAAEILAATTRLVALEARS